MNNFFFFKRGRDEFVALQSVFISVFKEKNVLLLLLLCECTMGLFFYDFHGAHE